jgi:hypothetical protein
MVKRRRDRQAWEFMGPGGIKNLPELLKTLRSSIEGSTVPYSRTRQTSHRAQSFDFRYEVIYV